MMKSYSNKFTKESFRSETGEPKSPIQIKRKEVITSAKNYRTKSVQHSDMYLSNREKAEVGLKLKANLEQTKNYTTVKTEFKTAKEPIKIKLLKSTKSLKQEKTGTEPKLNYAKIEIKSNDAKIKKEKAEFKYQRITSYEKLKERFLSPDFSKKRMIPRSNSNDAKSFPSKDQNMFKQYKINDVKTIIEVKEDKDMKDNTEIRDPREVKKVLKKLNTDKNILNISERNNKNAIPDLKKNLNKNNQNKTNIFTRLYNTANVNMKNTKFDNLKKPAKTAKPKKIPNKHLLAYAFSNPAPKSPKVRPLSESRKKLKEPNKPAVKPKSALQSKVPVPAKTRPKTGVKKYETEYKIHETSLSTQASSLFKGKIEDYAIGKEIGKGAYAIVKQALHKPTNLKLAVKIYEKSKLLDPQRNSSVKREIQILKKIDHSNIVKLHEVIDTPKQILLVMELVSGVSLLTFLKSKENRRLDILECKDVCYQITNAMCHLHEKKIVHRDIKLENILIDENKKVKIIDFGFGCITNDKKLDFFCGTPSYMPPEIVQKRDYVGEYADIWSMGILFYTLLCGAFPFRAQNEKELYSKITRGAFAFPDHVPNSACIIIRKILNLNPNLRPKAEDILNDAWFNSVRMIEASKIYQSFELAASNTVPKLLNES